MDSFVSWIGGKKSLREVIVQRFPKEYERYIEVFGGGGWILFHKKPEIFEVYNDYNSNLTNLYHVVKYQPVEFIKELGWLPLNGREEFSLLKSWINKDDFSISFIKNESQFLDRYMTDLELAEYIELIESQTQLGNVRRGVSFYKLIRYSYASGCTSFSCQPTSILKTYQAIWLANKRLNENGFKPAKGTVLSKDAGNGVIIENKDFEALIRHYDKDNAFFYCDPPYYMSEKHYVVDFPRENHLRLRNVLGEIKGKFLLSYNDCDFIRDLFQGFYIETVERINNISQRYDPGNMYKEVLIANYDLNERLRSEPKQISLL